MLTTYVARLAEKVTWVRVNKPSLDVVGLILGSIVATGILVLAALLIGLACGVALIRRRRRASIAGSDALIRLDIPSRDA